MGNRRACEALGDCLLLLYCMTDMFIIIILHGGRAKYKPGLYVSDTLYWPCKSSGDLMARPGGNPELKTSEYQQKYGFKQRYDWDEPCDQRMTLRMPASMKEAIKNGEIEDWQEVARQAIAKALGWQVNKQAEETL